MTRGSTGKAESVSFPGMGPHGPESLGSTAEDGFDSIRFYLGRKLSVPVSQTP